MLQWTILQTWYKKSLRPHEGLRVIWHCSPDFWEKATHLSFSKALSEALYALAAWRQTLSSLRVLLSANPSFSLHCVEDMLWKVLARTLWQQWGLTVWGPHSWLWKYDVVSRCIWGCTSLPLSVWSAFKPRRPTESFIMLPRGTHRLCGCIVDLSADSASLWFLSVFLLHSAVANWECTLSIPRGPPGPNSTCPIIGKYPQLILPPAL